MKWHIASVSWGKDSLAMLLTLIAKGYPLNEVVFYDTGMEFEAIYHTRDQMLPRLEQLGIKYTRLEPENPFLFDMLERPVCSKQKGTHQGYGWCGGLCRWGTTGKLKAIDRYCANPVSCAGSKQFRRTPTPQLYGGRILFYDKRTAPRGALQTPPDKAAGKAKGPQRRPGAD